MEKGNLKTAKTAGEAQANGKVAEAKANGKAGERDGAKGAALKAALTQIERQFGQGSLMRLGDDAASVAVSVVPDRSALARPRARSGRRPARSHRRDLRPRVLR